MLYRVIFAPFFLPFYTCSFAVLNSPNNNEGTRGENKTGANLSLSTYSYDNILMDKLKVFLYRNFILSKAQ